jgi:hypothetical protein
MNGKRVYFTGFSIVAQPSWKEMTWPFPKCGPFTLVKSSKGGALQFSPALYKAGPLPHLNSDALLAMAREFAIAKNLGPVFDEFTESGELTIAGLSVHSGSDFIRVWYIFDGKNVALATYLHIWGRHVNELAECEKIIRSLCFQ